MAGTWKLNVFYSNEPDERRTELLIQDMDLHKTLDKLNAQNGENGKKKTHFTVHRIISSYRYRQCLGGWTQHN